MNEMAGIIKLMLSNHDFRDILSNFRHFFGGEKNDALI